MRFGINTMLWTANFSAADLPILDKAKAWGYDGVEILLVDPQAFPAAALYQACLSKGLGLTAVGIASLENNPLSADAGVRRHTLDYFRACIKALAEAGGEMIAGPMYAPLGHFTGVRRTPDEWKRSVEFFQELAPTLDAHRITMALEPLNRFETYFLNTAADSVAFCEAINHPRIGILFDTFHANIEEKSIAEGYRTVGPYLKHVHTCENDRGTPGSGHVDWTGVFQALHDVNYDGWLTIESFGSALKEISAAARIWRDLEKDMDTLAADGLRFLKSSYN